MTAIAHQTGTQAPVVVIITIQSMMIDMMQKGSGMFADRQSSLPKTISNIFGKICQQGHYPKTKRAKIDDI